MADGEAISTKALDVVQLQQALEQRNRDYAKGELRLRRELMLRESLAREALRELLSRYQVRLVVANGDVQLVAE